VRKFKKIYIEITNVCNLGCDFCPKTGREPEFMSVEAFRTVLDQVKEYTDYIYLHVKGEPLLHPELDKLLKICHEKGFRVNITTNGTLICNVKDVLMMSPALRQINFSLHSFDGNEGNEGNKGIQNMGNYIGNILAFTKEAIEKSEVLISLRLWNLDEDNVSNRETKRNLKLLETIEKEYHLPFEIQEQVFAGRGIKIADRIYLNQDYQFKWPDLTELEDDGVGFCHGLRNQVAILVDGTVIPCCLDGEGVINLGNILSTHFSDIIESERACNIVEGFSQRRAVEELCRKCGYRKRFGITDIK
jgi:radical SAM protein with 4Fe4S-binding SPASM domain